MSVNDADDEDARQPLSRANGLVLVMNTPKGGLVTISQDELHTSISIPLSAMRHLAPILNRKL